MVQISLVFLITLGAREMALWLQALIAFPEDPQVASQAPVTPALTPWPLHLHSCAHTCMQTYLNTQLKLIKINL